MKEVALWVKRAFGGRAAFRIGRAADDTVCSHWRLRLHCNGKNPVWTA
jgi:hypothetical protein